MVVDFFLYLVCSYIQQHLQQHNFIQLPSGHRSSFNTIPIPSRKPTMEAALHEAEVGVARQAVLPHQAEI